MALYEGHSRVSVARSRGPDGARVDNKEVAMEARTKWWALGVGALSWLLAALAAAQSPAPTPAGPPPCTAPEYRQFDFWLGNWDVKDPQGAVVGTNRITREYDGCVLQEHWEARGPRKQTGSSFNTWSAPAQKWHQTWVDSTGGFLLLDGGLVEGKMVLFGEAPARVGGGRLRHRITWSPLPGGTVRQVWESSRDEGKTWTVAFDGLYVRKAD
jgi:hypothetical protein